MIPAGLRDTRIAFQSAAEVSDGGGGFTTTWTTQFSCWGAFTFANLRGNMEAINAGAVQSVVRADVVVPADSGTTETVTNEWRITAKGKTWNVRQVQPDVDGDIRMVVEAGTPT